MKKITFTLLLCCIAFSTINAQTVIWSSNGDDLTDFTLVDRDGDGFNWTVHDEYFGNPLTDYGLVGNAFGSLVYDDASDKDLDPNDLLYTPSNITIPAGATDITFNMKYAISDDEFSPNHSFEVYAYDAAVGIDFDALTTEQIGTQITTGTGDSTAKDFSAMIPTSLAGKNIGIVIRHFLLPSNFGDVLYLDDLNVSYNGTLSVKDNEIGISRVSPNPTSGIVKIDTHLTIDSATIYNQLGQEVKVFKNIIKNSIDLSSMNKGLYFLSIRAENKTKTIKVVKK